MNTFQEVLTIARPVDTEYESIAFFDNGALLVAVGAKDKSKSPRGVISVFGIDGRLVLSRDVRESTCAFVFSGVGNKQFATIDQSGDVRHWTLSQDRLILGTSPK
jgi:hypothetical protein